MANKLVWSTAALLVVAVVTGTWQGGGPVAGGSERITVTGSSTVAPLMLEIGRRFERVNPDVRVDVQTGGSSRGILDARSGLADIGMVSRALGPGEEDLTPFRVAMDGISLIVNRSNSIDGLTEVQVQDIYTGKVRNWREVAGPDLPVTVVNKAEGRSTLELFLLHYGLKNSDLRTDVVIGDNQQGIKTVAGNPGAIGYVSIGTAEHEAHQGVAIRQLPMAGKEATVANVREGNYPLSRPLNLVVTKPPLGAVKRFIDYAQSRAVHDLIEAQFFVPLTH